MLHPQKPFSQACEQNKGPILAVLQEHFAAARSVLEIGSGTGQHAVFFAANLPDLIWQPSDRIENHEGIRLWMEAAQLENVRAPMALDVAGRWPETSYDAVFSANTAHIMSWPEVRAMFKGVRCVLADAGLFAQYGPFSYAGRHTSPSNARFDAMLRERDPYSGIRDLDDLRALGDEVGLLLSDDHPMPANNRTLIWKAAIRGTP